MACVGETGLDLFNATDCDLGGVPPECACEFVRKVRACRLIARLPYLTLPKCYLTGDLEPLAGTILALWLLYIFMALALVVEYSVVPNLVTISKIFNLSDIVAGVTLLALGNGITDIFTAVSSVYAAPDGGALAVSGLLGSAMFVFTVNSAVIAILHAPKVDITVFSRDVFFYLLSLGWIGYMLSDKRIYAWQALVFVGIYIVYISYVVTSNARQQRWFNRAYSASNIFPGESLGGKEYENLIADDSDDEMDPETALLLGLSRSRTPVNGMSNGSTTPIIPVDTSTRPGVTTEVDPLIPNPRDPTSLPPSSSSSSTNGSRTPSRGPDSIVVVSSRARGEWERLLGLKTRSRLMRALIVLQAPLRLLLFISTPVLRIADYAERRSWNKPVVMMQAFVSVPLVAFIYSKEFSFDRGITVLGAPIAVLGFIAGLALAGFVGLTAGRTEPPHYRKVLPFWGFFVVVSIIFALTDEVVGLMRDFGAWFELSHSFIGIFVLGIANGMNDLIANYIVAKNGWPHVAISAIYGGSILNVLIGMALASAVGVYKYGDPYVVAFDEQNLLGLGASFFSLIYVLLSLASKNPPVTLSKKDGIVLLLLYGIFLGASLGTEIYCRLERTCDIGAT